MNNLYLNTIYEQFKMILPLMIWIISFSLWNLMLVAITKALNNRNWHENPGRLNETAREHIRQRDEIIHRQQKEIARLKYHNDKMWAALRAAQNAVNSVYDSGNEGIYKKREAS